jgi:cyclic pyranopterin monophosphate synthase
MSEAVHPEDGHPETAARMVDVTGKAITDRVATASCLVKMEQSTRDRISAGDVPKGDVLEVARIAGIMAAKRTADLIPLCHPIAIGGVDIDLTQVPDGIQIHARVRTADRTGVEMEALTAAAVAGLTVYDMVKGIDRSAEITDLRLLNKAGGKSGDWTR